MNLHGYKLAYNDCVKNCKFAEKQMLMAKETLNYQSGLRHPDKSVINDCRIMISRCESRIPQIEKRKNDLSSIIKNIQKTRSKERRKFKKVRR